MVLFLWITIDMKVVAIGKWYFLILNAVDMEVKMLTVRILQWMGRLIQDFYDIDDSDVCEQNRTNLSLSHKKDSGWLATNKLYYASIIVW